MCSENGPHPFGVHPSVHRHGKLSSRVNPSSPVNQSPASYGARGVVGGPKEERERKNAHAQHSTFYIVQNVHLFTTEGLVRLRRRG